MAPIRVGVLCSRRAPGLAHLLTRDANRGRLYELACCATTEESFEGQTLAADHGIPVIAHPIRQFCHARGWRVSDPGGRLAYDREMAGRLARYRLDLIVLAGYLYVLSEPMLDSFPHRIVNIHHSDLTLRNHDGTARLPGLRAVRDALAAGADETRATVHLVTKDLDEGPPLLRSWAFPVSPLVVHALANQSGNVLSAYGYAHQEWMIQSTWGPLAAAAIALVARGRLNLSDLAEAPGRSLSAPWELGEDGRIQGWSPLRKSA